MSLGEEKTFFKDSLNIKLANFVPDFIMQGPGKISTRSNKLNNPAAQLLVNSKDNDPFNLWLFQKFPDIQMTKYKTSYLFKLVGYKGREYTGLQVAKDPGANIVWLGSFLLIFSLFITFFTSHKRLWLTLDKQGDTIVVKIGGNANKNRFAFERHFYDISNKLKIQ